MIIVRIILFCLLVLLVVGVVRLLRGKPAKRELEYREEGAMVACAHCALHVPEDQAIHAGGQWYCSEEHRRAADGDAS